LTEQYSIELIDGELGESEKSMNRQDAEHLKLLSIFHYVMGGLTAVFALIPIPHMVIGILALRFPDFFQESDGEVPPALFGWFFLIGGATVAVTALMMAVCVIFSGRFIGQRQRYWFSFVVACIECLFTPYGTALGIFTLIVLSRDSVKALYGLSSS
jgi:hypothetical protein